MVIGQTISFANLKMGIATELDNNVIKKKVEIRYIIEVNSSPIIIRNDMGVRLYLKNKFIEQALYNGDTFFFLRLLLIFHMLRLKVYNGFIFTHMVQLCFDVFVEARFFYLDEEGFYERRFKIVHDPLLMKIYEKEKIE